MRTTEERLSTLEKQVRTYRRLSLLLVLLLSVGLTAAMVQDKNEKDKVIKCDLLKAKRIEVSGEGRAGLILASDGGKGFLAVIRRSGKIAALLSADNDGGHLKMLSTKGKGRAVIRFDDAGAGGFFVCNPAGTPVAALSVRGDSGGLLVTGPNKKRSASLLWHKDGSGGLYIFNPRNVHAAALISSPQGRGMLNISSTKGQTVLVADCNNKEEGRILLTNSQGHLVVGLGAGKDGNGEVWTFLNQKERKGRVFKAR